MSEVRLEKVHRMMIYGLLREIIIHINHGKDRLTEELPMRFAFQGMSVQLFGVSVPIRLPESVGKPRKEMIERRVTLTKYTFVYHA